MLLYNYKDFLFESKVVLSTSDKLRRVLKSIDDPISKMILKK